MNGISVLGSLLPLQAWRPAAGASGMGAATNNQVVNPPDAAQSPDSTVTNALQELVASLQGLRSIADTLRTQLESMLGDTNGASSVASAVHASLRQRASFKFVTQEGDVVRLSVRSRASIASSAASVQDASGSAAASKTTLIASARLSIQVHGDLNEQELAAIKDVLGQVETLADQFFGGDVQAAFTASASLHIDSSQLASMALDLSSRLRLSGAAQSTMSSGPGDTSTSGAPSASAATVLPATASATSPAPAASAAPTAAVAPTPAAAPVAAAATPVSPTTTPVTVLPAVSYLGNVVSQLQGVTSIEMSLKSKLQLLLIAVLPGAAATSADATGAAGKSARSAPGVAALTQLSDAAPLH